MHGWRILILGCLAFVASHAAEYKRAAGPGPVATLKTNWTDAQGQRSVPALIYYPKTGAGPFPIVIFSPGLGGTREGYGYLGTHWASHGYVSVHLQHAGSDDAVWRGNPRPRQAMQAAAADPRNALNRPLDVRLAIDQMLRLHTENSPLQGRLDTNRIGVAGHSFGAYTTLAVAGQSRGAFSLADSRVTAAIAMSAPVPRGNREDVYAAIKIPILHLTGTLDDSPIGNTSIAERRIPFDSIRGTDQYLATFNGADHMVFSGRSGIKGDRSQDARFHALIRQSTTAFWDAYLKGNAQARQWLAEGGFAAEMGRDGIWEQRVKPPK